MWREYQVTFSAGLLGAFAAIPLVLAFRDLAWFGIGASIGAGAVVVGFAIGYRKSP